MQNKYHDQKEDLKNPKRDCAAKKETLKIA